MLFIKKIFLTFISAIDKRPIPLEVITFFYLISAIVLTLEQPARSEHIVAPVFQSQHISSDLEAQVLPISQFSNIQPTDWAFQALQSLIERYGITTSYLHGAHGEQEISRFEFAASLNSVLNRINQLIETGSDNLLTHDDLITLQRLQEEFTPELNSLRKQVEDLEVRIAQTEANQFSATTKLIGQVIMAASTGGFLGESIIDPVGEEIKTDGLNATVIYRPAFNFNTSFRGTDLLRVLVDTGSGGVNDNIAGILEPTFGSALEFSVEPPIDKDIEVARLQYTFQPSQGLTISVGPFILTTDYVDLNSYANLSFRDFSTRAFVNNLILFPLDGPSAGVVFNWKPVNNVVTIRALYAAAEPQNPSDEGFVVGVASFVRLLYPNGVGNQGIFGGDTYQTTLEFEYTPSTNFAIRLQYSGGEMFNNRFNVVGVNFEYRFSLSTAIFGRYGYGDYNNTTFGNLNPSYWMLGLAFPDLITQGALAGIAVGQPFIESNIGNATQTNYEVFYNLPIYDNIQLTPLLQVITNPSNQDANGTVFTGTLRTVFSL